MFIMRIYSSIFWLSSPISILWCGYAFIGLGIREFYHPMAASGDLLHPLRQWSMLVPLVTVAVIFVCWLLRRPLSVGVYVAGTCCIVDSALLPLLPRVDSGYKQVYWIGDQQYQIPWQYGPFNGQDEPGGSHFLVRVSPEGWAPRYVTDKKTIIVGIASDWSTWRNLSGSAEICSIEEYRFQCQWSNGRISYHASGHPDLTPINPEAFAIEVTELLDGFATRPN
ncbi:MAG: hypothetical protein AAF899_11795 [Pseudomonadota bacterium]